MANKLHLRLTAGKTFSRVLRYGAPPFIYRPITGITKAAPAVFTVVAHGIPDGWLVVPVSVGGMTAINAPSTVNNPGANPKLSEYKRATVVDVDHVKVDGLNSSEFDAYTSGGVLQFYTPVDISTAIVRCYLKDKAGGTTLQTLTSVASAGVAIDNTAKTITLTIAAGSTAAVTAKWHEIEIEISGVITELASGPVSVRKD